MASYDQILRAHLEKNQNVSLKFASEIGLPPLRPKKPKKSNLRLSVKDTDLTAKIIDLRRKGLGYAEIASDLEITEKVAAAHVKKFLMYSLPDSAENTKRLELLRLDSMVKAFTPAADAGDIKAAEFILRVMARRSRFLGLDSDIKIDATVSKYRDVPIEELKVRWKQITNREWGDHEGASLSVHEEGEEVQVREFVQKNMFDDNADDDEDEFNED